MLLACARRAVITRPRMIAAGTGLVALFAAMLAVPATQRGDPSVSLVPMDEQGDRLVPPMERGPLVRRSRRLPPAEPILQLPALGRFSYRCDDGRRSSVTFAVPERGASVFATVRANRHDLRRSVRVDPGRRLTTSFRAYRRQAWRLLYHHKPGTITAHVRFGFEVDAVGDCLVTPVQALIRRKSHASAGAGPVGPEGGGAVGGGRE